jgi:hypothetical protein
MRRSAICTWWLVPVSWILRNPTTQKSGPPCTHAKSSTAFLGGSNQKRHKQLAKARGNISFSNAGIANCKAEVSQEMHEFLMHPKAEICKLITGLARVFSLMNISQLDASKKIEELHSISIHTNKRQWT